MSTTAQFKEFGPFFLNGALVTAPHIFHYLVGTTTLKDAYADRGKLATVAQPLVGDANGLASAYWDGIYKIVVKSSDELSTLATWDQVRIIDGVAETKSTWAPTLTCTSPGDLSVSYTDNTGYYERVGDEVTAWFSVVTSAFAYTTAAGFIALAGLPFTATADLNPWVSGGLIWGGMTKANYTSVAAYVAGGAVQVSLSASGSGQSAVALAITDFPTGGTVKLQGCVRYLTAA